MTNEDFLLGGKIHEVLLEIGIPSNLLGFMYITYAVQLLICNQEYLKNLSSRLYVDVAAKFNTNAACVERCIRHAISVGWTTGNIDVIHHIFKNSVNPMKGSPTNSQFLSRMFFYMNSIS
ncbi:MAG: sporulation initiation factor Spo0A C-terminal domain-containing protein [Bacillota bacterium]|nr:sporulation initiation factor Spo0A C-terminal domain-containing protein [Bacillota bacterium]